MSIFGRLLAGAGAGAASVSSRYIDEEIANNRAKFLSDLEQQNFEKRDQYQNSDAVVGRNRANRVADETAIGTARNTVDLAGKKAQAMDTELRAGEVARAGDLAGAAATASANASAEVTSKYGNDPKHLAALRNEAKAKHVESAASSASALESQFRLGLMKRESTLRDDLVRAVEAGDRAGEEKTRDKLRALDPKSEGKVSEFYKIAEGAARAMAPAQKIIADSMTSPEAKADAEQTVREQRALMSAAAKRAGVDLADASKLPEAQAHSQALAALAAPGTKATIEEVNRRLAAGGYKPLPANGNQAEKPPGKQRTAAPDARYEPPADSPAGKFQAKAAQEVATRQQESYQKQDEATQAFAAASRGGRSAASRLQAGPLFGLLNQQQQMEIYKLANGR